MTVAVRKLDRALPRIEMRSAALIARQQARVCVARPSPADVLPFLETRWGGLTLLQCAILYIIGYLTDEDGVFRLPMSKIEHHLNGAGSQARCLAIPHELVRFGLLDNVGRVGVVHHFRLTLLGETVFDEIAGERGA